ncbi:MULTISPECIES: tRNA (adenine(22)-N(1))-methyltransferase TrmK [Pseudoalteromonas]|uniref:tRNA (adenine(22)-N(1))-methyltransferase n=1 Tax=Pseudoalteromonas TaxID=53246 RepID=UPI000FFE4D03|nr:MULTISPECIES: tRNA (adenine(22)-N(1))-methyltransferase TrmK [Pseudoalteromonas]NKC18282.1 SAM-dependent methyltransferase [Pseudoalteromonas galatheae]RXE85211.1 SAM-dependent methyltransferase [Pseudoalteromonas sp. A757]
MKLGKRLQTLHDVVTEDYQHIWDCCCDHGQLGAQFLDSSQAHIHFVDVVPALIAKVKLDLARFFPEAEARYSLYTQDVAKLPLAQHSGRQLVIIAGVGGDLTAELMTSLCHKLPDEVDFLLCPVHHHYTLRQTLQSLPLKLIHESLVEENRRIYEVLYLTSGKTGAAITPLGKAIWQQGTLSKRYLEKTLEHYARVAKGKPEAQNIFSAYQQVTLSIG